MSVIESDSTRDFRGQRQQRAPKLVLKVINNIVSAGSQPANKLTEFFRRRQIFFAAPQISVPGNDSGDIGIVFEQVGIIAVDKPIDLGLRVLPL